MSEPAATTVEGLEELDKLLEHRLRLGICVLLARYDRISFSRFKELLDESDGNLGANLRRLEDEGYLKVKKEFVDRRPVSWYSLTAKGRAHLRGHIAALQQVLATAASGGATGDA